MENQCLQIEEREIFASFLVLSLTFPGALGLENNRCLQIENSLYTVFFF